MPRPGQEKKKREIPAGHKMIGRHIVPNDAVAVIEFMGGVAPCVPRKYDGGITESKGECVERIKEKLKNKGITSFNVI